jgi:hypothetical protein
MAKVARKSADYGAQSSAPMGRTARPKRTGEPKTTTARSRALKRFGAIEANGRRGAAPPEEARRDGAYQRVDRRKRTMGDKTARPAKFRMASGRARSGR